MKVEWSLCLAVENMAESRPVRMRLALAQLNAVVGDLAGNRALIVDAIREARGAGADLVLFPELAVTGYPPEDLLLRPGLRQGRPRLARRDHCRHRGDHRARRLPALRSRSRERVRRALERRAARRLPQALPPQLRRLRRAPLLRRRPRARPAPLWRRARRPDDLRGHLAARAARDRPLARRRAADREPLRLAVPRRQGRGPRGDARHPGAGQRVVPGVLQPRRRPGRARLRRPLRRARRRGRGDRARARVRGGAADRRPRPDRGDRPPAPRRAPARARALSRRRAGGDRDRPPRAGHPGRSGWRMS